LGKKDARWPRIAEGKNCVEGVRIQTGYGGGGEYPETRRGGIGGETKTKRKSGIKRLEGRAKIIPISREKKRELWGLLRLKIRAGAEKKFAERPEQEIVLK